MSTAACAPILGKVGDVIGRRKTLLWGITVFTLGNALSALANSLVFMMIARFVVGIGTAAMGPVILAYIATEFPRDQIAKGFSLYMLLSSASVIIGPTIGALVVSSYGWRAMLWVCVAICAGVFIGCVLTSRNQVSVKKPLQDFDVPVKLSGMNLSVSDNRILNTLLYSISDIERMADHAMAVAKAALEMEKKKIEFSRQAKGELAVLEQAVLDIVDRTVAAYGSFDLEQAARIEPQEQVVDALVREVKSRHVRRLRDGLCTVEYGFVLEDLLTACERTADHCSNVAVEMLQVAEGKLEAHEYLNALKAGELQESAAFTEQFAQYKARYAFPEEN